MRGGEFAQPWGIPVYKTCLSVHWSWLDFCVLPSSFRKVSPPLGFQTRFAIRSLEDCMLHVSECVWHCYHHYQPLTTLSAKWSFQDFVLWTEYINQWVRTGATGLKLCLCGRQLCLSKICFFFLYCSCDISTRSLGASLEEASLLSELIGMVSRSLENTLWLSI